MSAPPRVRDGAVVAWWNGGELEFAVCGGEDKRRVRLVTSRGREERVSPARVALEADAPGAVPGSSAEERKSAAERAARIRSAAEDAASEVDVPMLWEIVRDAPAEVALSPVELCELALGASDGVAQAGLLLALSGDRIHFARRGDAWQARSEESVRELIVQRERLELRRQESEALLAVLSRAARGETVTLGGGETERRTLDALEQLAILDDAAPPPARSTAVEALEASGLRHDRPAEGAFRLLLRLGRFTDENENLPVLRYRLRTEFADEVRRHAREAAERGFDRAGRRDLCERPTISIDSASTREIDDALSLEPTLAGGVRLGVHISDPTAFVRPGDPVDREALGRGLSHYMPDRRLIMLPPEIGEEAASLVAGVERPALSFLIEVDADGAITDCEIVRSVIRVDDRLDYDAADRTLAEGGGAAADLLGPLDEVARLREEYRRRAGAVVIRSPDVDLQVGADGTVSIARLPGDSVSRRIVTEAMVAAGAAGAEFLRSREVPATYRRQAIERDPAAEPVLEIVDDPVVRRRLMRRLSRAVTGLEPGPHASLGLSAYAQVSSPLRRFQDLVLHRQIVAVLAGAAPFYDVEAMQRIAATTEQAEADARRAERAAREFWMLRYLESRTGETVEGRVIEDEPRPVVQLCETLWEQPMPSLRGIPAGERVALRIERVNPRAGLLVLRRLG